MNVSVPKKFMAPLVWMNALHPLMTETISVKVSLFAHHTNLFLDNVDPTITNPNEATD